MKKITILLFLGILIGVLPSCKKSDPPLPDNLVQFETGEQGFGSDVSTMDVKLTLSRNTDKDIPVEIGLTENGVLYGRDYTTLPAAVNNSLSLTIPSGSNSVSFTISKVSDIFLQGDESVSFKINAAGTPVLVGNTETFQLKFSAIISDGGSLTLNGGPGGAAAENTVFVDLSANQQTAVKRDSWNLGFYNGDPFRVILNNTLSNAMATALNKNDLNAVGAGDTVGMVLVSTYEPEDLDKVDDYTGDLTKTVIGEVSANDADNKVYILNLSGLSDDTKGWVKIRVIRSSAGGYTLQYANIADASFKTVDIPKESAHQFSFVSLVSGQLVNVQPEKNRWDFEWGLGSYVTASGGSNIYYPFSDLVFINNLDGVQAAEVLTSTVSYDSYAESNIATTSLSSDRDAIGSKWRATTGTKGVLTDRFFVIKDPAGNVYKLKFVNFIADDGGTRGYPNISYSMVKKGS
jgi:hypothetical protein